MNTIRTSFSSGALPVRVAAAAILCTLAAIPAVYGQQASSTTPSTGSTERRGFGYGMRPTATPAPSTPAWSAAPPTTPAPTAPAPTAPAPTTTAPPTPEADSSAAVVSPPASDSVAVTASDHDSTVIHLDDVMTRREWDATGVARLQPEQRAALEAWVQRYRDNVSQSAGSKPLSGPVSNGEVASTPAPVAPPTGYMSSYAAPVAPPPSASAYPVPAPAPQYPAQAAAPQYPSQTPAPPYPAAAEPAAAAPPAGTVIKAGLAVQDILGANRFLSLSDGSMWEVYSADRGATTVWQIKDPVDVRTTTSIAAGYDREIVNASRDVLVRVKYIGQAGN